MLMPSIVSGDLFDDFFNDPWFNNRELRKSERDAEKNLYGHNAAKIMKTDIKELEDAYELTMNLPGFEKDDVKASLEDGYLTISAGKTLEKDEKDGKESKKDKYILRERYSGSCQRTFYVGDSIKQDDIKASFKHGILTLMIPKKEKEPEKDESKFITIEG